MIGLSILSGYVSLITAGSYYRPVSAGDDTDHGVFAGRITNSDLPVFSVRLRSKYLDISAQIKHGARNTHFLKKSDDPLGRITLGDSAEIDLASFRQSDLACLRIELNCRAVYKRYCFRESCSVRNIDRCILLFDKIFIVIEFRKSPGSHDRIDCNIKRAVRHLINRERFV